MGSCLEAMLGGDELTPEAEGPGGQPGASEDPSMPFPNFVGSSFEKHFRLEDELGKGGYSVVRKGVYKKSGQEYAVKCMKRDGLPKEDEADLFTEVAILRSLHHPNIISVYQIYKDNDDYIYVVEEFMKGGELFDRIVKQECYNEKEARNLCAILLSSVKYCHDKNIVHRDLKPENLLLASDGDNSNIKLADFGFARSLTNGLLKTQCGTPGYVAPEIVKGEPYGASVDMWSVGVIMYILLGGYPPFHDEDQTRLFRKIKTGTFEFHAEYWDAVSKEAKDLISRLLTVDPSKRITAAEAVIHPWMLGSQDADLAKNSLDKNLKNLQLFNARRKLRGAVQSILLSLRLSASVEYL